MFNTAQDLVNEIKIGWNLGNTLENMSVSCPYEEEILKKTSYCTWGYIVDNLGGWQNVGSSTQKIIDGIKNVSTVVSSIDSTEYLRTCNKFNFQVSNYAIGDTGQNTLIFTISNFTITKNGIATSIPVLNNQYCTTKNTSGIVSITVVVDFALFGYLNLQAFVGATISYTVVINNYLMPVNPLTKEDWTEKYFKNPVTTKAMLETVKNKGFNAIRIPCSWFQHWDEYINNFDYAWINRIKKIIDWCMELELITILNMHHDGFSTGWIKAYTSRSALDDVKVKLSNYWNRIAYEFRNYSDLLVFEGMNEILDMNSSWASPTIEEQNALNELMQTFVYAVRQTGFNNTNRILSISTYACLPYYNNFGMPWDVAETVGNKLIANVHLYSPQDFCWYTGNGNGNTALTTYNNTIQGPILDELFNNLQTVFINNNIPLIIGEFASYSKNNTAERILHAQSYISKTKNLGIKCFWWDVGGDGARTESQIQTGALLNRHNNTWWFESLVDALITSSID